ncbi:1-acyl-sn-glycerol-3-phosphate acyltransferases [Austwickia chelonae]|uniref:Putative acyltransferase n=2 Tax=Austwickia TaxID=1184606 RepID=K6VML3_9MICO|nr:putative acyltransferase [Austwickia chelonae NBRC 105200]SEW27736.1 1-acyl-sn-glycerol-3-phosphate acyltransferases [Austwickia chelonae]
MSSSRSGSEGLNGTYRLGMFFARTSIGALTRDRWAGAEHLPKSGGFLVCANHISQADPFAVARFLYDSGHFPYFLAKESLFRAPVIGPIMTRSGQIPVHRGTSHASHAFQSAIDAVAGGKCVVLMPEGTLTKDPDWWPMTGKTGAARVALATGRPVIPLAQWGTQFIRHRKADKGIRVVSHMLAGPAVKMDDLYGQELDGPLLREATERIMSSITVELEKVRRLEAPRGRWDLRAGRRIERVTREDFR